MISLFKKDYNIKTLSKETKNNILKHKRRIRYFLIFIPAMFILLGYVTNSLMTNDYIVFKLTHVFLLDLIAKIILNILPIITLTVVIAGGLATIYKPGLVEKLWISAFILGLISYFYNPMKFLLEFIYQLNILWNENKLIPYIFLFSLFVLLIMFSRTRKSIVNCIINGGEIFLISAIIYLEVIGEYECLFFMKTFVNLFTNSLRFLNGIGEIIILGFISFIFMSLYSNKLKAIIFHIKNKRELKNKIKVIKESPENYPNVEIVQIADKIKMPLLTHKSLPTIAAIIPAFNESKTILSTTNSILKSDYDKDKLFTIVVSDGSTDDTVDLLVEKYSMYKATINQVTKLTKHGKVKSIYKSRMYKGLILIDKVNGGKSDALNLGIEYLPKEIEYIGVIDADSIVDKYALRTFATTAQENKEIVALTGTILPLTNEDSDCKTSLLSNIQLFDYLSSFHGDRGALSLLNSILIIPGAFGFFDRWALLELEGYSRDVLAEDGVLTVNLHRKKNVVIKFVPEALSYTQVPSTFKDLRKQRMRWFKGLTELLILFKNIWKENTRLSLVFLEYLLIEWLTPIMIPIGLCMLIANPSMITHTIFKLFMMLAIVTPMVKGFICIVIESSYRKVNWRKLVYLPLSILLSPLIVLWRNDALLDLGNKSWGAIKRY